MNHIDLNDIKLFVSTIQAGSLSRAAELMNIPKSRLSRRLTELEKALGTTLVDRGRKGIVLNELGKRFYPEAQQMLQSAQQAIDVVQQDLTEPKGLLRLSIASEVARDLILPLLSEYLARYSQVSLDINVSNKKIHLIQDGIDLAIRVGSLDNENVIAKKLLDIEFALYASQDYLAQKGTPQSPYELYQHDLLHKTDGTKWRFQFQDQQIEVNGVNKICTNDFNLIAELIAQNVGIGLLPHFERGIQPDWVRLLPDWKIASSPLSILYYKNRGNTRTIQSMVQFLIEKLV